MIFPGEICTKKFSYHEIFRFLLKVQWISNEHFRVPHVFALLGHVHFDCVCVFGVFLNVASGRAAVVMIGALDGPWVQKPFPVKSPQSRHLNLPRTAPIVTPAPTHDVDSLRETET
jgi:hypothetical protein